MNESPATAIEITRLRHLALVLIPAHGGMPGAADVQGYDQWLERAIKACGYSAADRMAAIAALPANLTWDSAKAFSRSHPEEFAIVSTLVSAAYYMSPAVLAKLGYPDDRRNPAGAEEFLTEYETGVFDQMMARQPQFRVAPK